MTDIDITIATMSGTIARLTATVQRLSAENAVLRQRVEEAAAAKQPAGKGKSKGEE